MRKQTPLRYLMIIPLLGIIFSIIFTFGAVNPAAADDTKPKVTWTPPNPPSIDYNQCANQAYTV